MQNNNIAKLFQNGRSQAVRLPKEFRFKGNSVRIRQVPGGVLLQSLVEKPEDWFANLDKLNSEKFPARLQPKTPRRKIFS